MLKKGRAKPGPEYLESTLLLADIKFQRSGFCRTSHLPRKSPWEADLFDSGPLLSQEMPRAKGLSPQHHPEGHRQGQQLFCSFLPQAKATNELGKPVPWGWGSCRDHRQTSLRSCLRPDTGMLARGPDRARPHGRCGKGPHSVTLNPAHLQSPPQEP